MAPGTSGTKPRCTAGSRGLRSRIPEHVVVLAIALALRDRIEAEGVSVGLSRSGPDVTLSNIERARMAAASGAAFWVRLHCNGVRWPRVLGRWRSGTLTLRPSPSRVPSDVYAGSARLAEILHPATLRGTGLRDLGMVERSDLAGFNYSNIPVVLLELGYLTHPGDERVLLEPERRKVLVECLAAGVLGALEVFRR